MNKFEILKNILARSKTPEQIVRSMVGSNPIAKNLIEMADRGDKQGLETFARNMLKERNINYDEEFKKFMDAMK